MEVKLKNHINKKGISPLILGAAGLAIGAGAAAAITYKKNEKFQKKVNDIIEDARGQSLKYTQQLQSRFKPQIKKVEKKLISKKKVLKKK